VVRIAVALAERIAGHVAIAIREPARIGRRIAVRLDVGLPTADEQRAQWQAVLGPRAEQLNGQLDRVVSHFRLGWPDMQAAGAAVADQLDAARAGEGDAAEHAGAALWDACRRQGRPRIEDLAQRLEPSSRWEELVLPDEQLAILREIATHVRHRRRVYDGWGFAARSSRGLGISALFAGQSGTGKTMAAEVLAAELRLDLYRIDLSQVVSKYIGETEKNLRRIFDAAEQGGAILLFDEADALFGKRAEVKDSHDRYANIEVSYLLQKMEAYRGLAILTTNLKSALDTAFLRRVRFVVHFPFPDAVERGELWRRAFPPTTPTAALDADRLARLHLAGGNIRNVALHAAFLAAEADQPVTMGHVLRAARAEYVKLENPFTESEMVVTEPPAGGHS
jgi:ATP-dependent 26S proteasome regulatory subunit